MLGISDRLADLRFWERVRFPNRLTRDLTWGILIGIAVSLSSTSAASLFQNWRRKKAISRIPPRPIELRSEEIVDGVIGLIGNTPLIRINSLSDALGVEILGKCEFLNPGGSVKDRVALRIIEDAEEQGLLKPNTGSVLFEGTVGSTGISLATVGKAKGYECCIIMPDDVAIEKVQVLEKLGAKVERVRPASIVDEKQFVNLARKRALAFGQTDLTDGRAGLPKHGDELVVATTASPSEVEDSMTTSLASTSSGYAETKLRTALSSIVDSALDQKPRGFFADQFENESNFQAHFHGTGPEILRQVGGSIDAFVSGAGTGGTIAGTGRYLKDHVPEIQVVLSDPEGSGLYNKVRFNVMFDPKEKEGRKRRHQVDTVVEGIGINRITQNFALGLDMIDDAYRVSDAEAVAMSRHLVNHDGLFLGSSSACNLVACVKLAKKLGRGARIVTILCDAHVRLATHTVTGRRAACKILPALHSRDRNPATSDIIMDAVEAHKELVFLKGLNGAGLKGVVGLEGIIVDGGWTYVFLTLFSRSVSSSDRPWERHHLVPFYRQLLFTVKSLHALDISHEDIKRSNILIGKNNTPVLVDFGFGHFNPNRLYVKSAGGTLDYTSPEKVLDELYDPQANDVWALGILLLKMLGTIHPFGNDPDDTIEVLKNRIVYEPLLIPWKSADWYHGGPAVLVESILQKDPNKRLTIDQILQNPFLSTDHRDPIPFRIPPLHLPEHVPSPIPPSVIEEVAFLAYANHDFFLCESYKKIIDRIKGSEPCWEKRWTGMLCRWRQVEDLDWVDVPDKVKDRSTSSRERRVAMALGRPLRAIHLSPNAKPAVVFPVNRVTPPRQQTPTVMTPIRNTPHMPLAPRKPQHVISRMKTKGESTPRVNTARVRRLDRATPAPFPLELCESLVTSNGRAQNGEARSTSHSVDVPKPKKLKVPPSKLRSERTEQESTRGQSEVSSIGTSKILNKSSHQTNGAILRNRNAIHQNEEDASSSLKPKAASIRKAIKASHTPTRAGPRKEHGPSPTSPSQQTHLNDVMVPGRRLRSTTVAVKGLRA